MNNIITIFQKNLVFFVLIKQGLFLACYQYDHELELPLHERFYIEDAGVASLTSG